MDTPTTSCPERISKIHINWTKDKKPYHIKVIGVHTFFIVIRGRNNFVMRSGAYCTKFEANQMAKRLAKNLGLELR